MLELPRNLDREVLTNMMRDERYANPAHPQHKAYRKLVTEGFDRLYGCGPAQRDASGRIIDPDPA